MAALTQSDYKQILEYYKMSIPSNTKQMKHDAEKIISEKLNENHIIFIVEKINE